MSMNYVVPLKNVRVKTPYGNGNGTMITDGVLVSDNGVTAQVLVKGSRMPREYPSNAVTAAPSIRNAKRIPTSMPAGNTGAFANSLRK